jgi:hypothetical protein
MAQSGARDFRLFVQVSISLFVSICFSSGHFRVVMRRTWTVIDTALVASRQPGRPPLCRRCLRTLSRAADGLAFPAENKRRFSNSTAARPRCLSTYSLADPVIGVPQLRSNSSNIPPRARSYSEVTATCSTGQGGARERPSDWAVGDFFSPSNIIFAAGAILIPDCPY